MHFTHNANGSCGFSGWSAVGFRRSLEHTSYPRAACFGGNQRDRKIGALGATRGEEKRATRERLTALQMNRVQIAVFRSLQLGDLLSINGDPLRLEALLHA